MAAEVVAQAVSGLPKDAKDHIPYCADQGMPNIMGTVLPGQTLFSFFADMPAMGGDIDLPYEMADTNYRVTIHNHTTEAKQGIVPVGTRTVKMIVVTGPAAGEDLEIWVQGTLKGQTA